MRAEPCSRHLRANGLVLGVVTAVPANAVSNLDIPGADAAATVTGVRSRRRVLSPDAQTALALAAARALLSVVAPLSDFSPPVALVYVTQTPDTLMPAPAFAVASALGLDASGCLVVPVNYSCAGYVYGLWLAMALANSLCGDVLLIVGDTTSTICDPKDRATAPLFGDAVSATYVQHRPSPARFVLGSDGKGAAALSQRPEEFLHMEGPAVFQFVLNTVPQLVEDILAYGTVDAVLFHQANAMILDRVARKLRLDNISAPSNIALFGNTSSASIPLLLCDRYTLARARCLTVAMVGFGAGWAWGAVRLSLEGLMHLEMIEVKL